jgi:mannonate dehydratase
MCLCVGCWLEGGKLMGKDVIETIRYFGAQHKLFKVHFRNVTAPLPHFVETFVDSGYMDMYKVMKALREVKFSGVVIADHVPGMVGGARAATAYTVAYMRALIDRVEKRGLEAVTGIVKRGEGTDSIRLARELLLGISGGVSPLERR